MKKATSLLQTQLTGGYERLVHKLNTNELNGRSFTFKLAEKQAMLRDVMILPDAMRKKYLQLFRENFLGLTEEAYMSKIPNINAVNFSAGDDKILSWLTAILRSQSSIKS